MKLNKIYISAFGKLKDFTLELSDGLNVIYGENENGKSTVMAFIKMMFYGSPKSSQNLSKSPRKKYAPWDGGQMAGSIEFEHSGRHYRIERTFGASNSADKVFLCDLDLGTRASAESDIGKTFFSLSLPAFERSVFIESTGSVDANTDADSELNSKLSNLAYSGDENISYGKILKRLEDAKHKLIGKTGKTGEYAKLCSNIDELKISLNTAIQKKEYANSLKEQIDTLLKEVSALEQEAKTLKASIESEKDIRNAQKLKNMLSLKGDLDELNKSLQFSDGGYADEMFVNKLVFCISKIENISSKISDKTRECQNLKETIELAENPGSEITPENAEKTKVELNKAKAENSSLSELCHKKKSEIDDIAASISTQSEKKTISLPCLIGSGVCLAVFIALFILNFNFSFVFAATFLILLVLAFVIKPKNRKYADLQNKISALKAELSELEKRLGESTNECNILSSKFETINNFLNSNTAVIERQKALLEETSKELEALFEEAKAQENDLFSLYSRYSDCKDIDTIKQSLAEIKEKASKQKEIKQQLNYIAKDVGNISYDEAAQKLKAIPDSIQTETLDFEALKTEYESKAEHILNHKNRIAELSAEYKSAANAENEVSDIKAKICAGEQKAMLMKNYYDKVSLAAEVLTESFAEIRSGYGGMLEQKAGDIFTGLTNGAYKKVNISKSFDISVEHSEHFGGKEADYLSAGAYDQAYLSLRLALSSLITENSEPLPVILDDPFVNYDDTRTHIAAEYLKEFSESVQTVVFTCHSFDMNSLSEIGASAVVLN